VEKKLAQIKKTNSGPFPSIKEGKSLIRTNLLGKDFQILDAGLKR